MNAFDIFGYIDPGTGSYIFQLLVAGALSVMMMFRNFRTFLRAKFAAIFRKRD